MRTKKWLQTAIVGFGGVERKIPFSYFFPDFDEMGPVVIFVNEKENGEIDVYKVYTESGFMIEETNVPSTYVVEIKTISKENTNDEIEETLEEILEEHPPNSNSPEGGTRYRDPMFH